MRCFRIKSKVTLGTNTSPNLGGSLVFLFHGGIFVSIPWNAMFDSQGVPPGVPQGVTILAFRGPQCLMSSKQLQPVMDPIFNSKWTILLLVGGFNPIENISQIGWFPQVGLKVIKAFETTAQVVSCSLIPGNLYFKCSKAFKPRRISTFHDLQLYGIWKLSRIRSNWDTEPELSCEVLMRIHLLHSSFTSNICQSSKSSQGYLALLSQQYWQQSCFVTTPGQISVSFGRSKRYRETKSSIIPLTLCFWPQGWRCYSIGVFMRFEVLKLNLSRSRWSVTHQPGRFRCKTPLPGHNMHPLPLVHVALAPLHSRRH